MGFDCVCVCVQESDMLFNVIEDILDNANSTVLSMGQTEFNTSGR